MDKFCECKDIGKVARDMKSTCMKCGGIDAYKTSKSRVKCSSCINGYDGTKGNGYQPCGCADKNYKPKQYNLYVKRVAQ